MANNVFLAYLPVEMSFYISSRLRPFAFWGLVAAWTLFYPNAPYILTDYFHLAHIDPYVVVENGRHRRILRPDLRLWLTFTDLSVSAMVSSLLGMWSLDRVVGGLQSRLKLPGFRWQVSFVAVFAALASVGIYLGRFPRLHSVYVLTRPRHALGQIATVCGLNMLEFVLMLVLIQLVVWGCLRFLRADWQSKK